MSDRHARGNPVRLPVSSFPFNHHILTREMFDWLHRPRTRQKGKEALNALKVVLGTAEKALDGVPVPGPKAAVGALLFIINALEVSLPLARFRNQSVYSLFGIRKPRKTLMRLKS